MLKEKIDLLKETYGLKEQVAPKFKKELRKLLNDYYNGIDSNEFEKIVGYIHKYGEKKESLSQKESKEENPGETQEVEPTKVNELRKDVKNVILQQENKDPKQVRQMLMNKYFIDVPEKLISDFLKNYGFK